MDRVMLENVLQDVEGATFASIDAETFPSPGILKRVSGKRVILFTNKRTSGYEQMVKRRLVEAGKNPANFVLGDLSWGERVPNSPLILHKGKVYLQCIELSPGTEKFFIALTMKEVDPADLNLKSSRTNQGLPTSEEIQVRCYDIEHINRIALMGEQLVSEAPQRTILRISG